MESTLLTHLQALETALSSLTRSISAHNPSTAASSTLLSTTSTTLSTSLTDLATHQRNHAHIQHLRAATTALDVRLTTHLRALADLRDDIRRAPLHGPKNMTEEEDGHGGARGAVGARELLAYGRATARYLTPRDYKPPSARRAEAEAGGAIPMGVGGQQDGVVILQASPAGSPAVSTPAQSASASASASAGQTLAAEGEGAEGLQGEVLQDNAGLQALTSDDRKFIRLDREHEPGYEPFANFQMFARSVLPNWQGPKEDFLRRIEDERTLHAADLEAERKREQQRVEAEEKARTGNPAAKDRSSHHAGQHVPQATAFAGWDDED